HLAHSMPLESDQCVTFHAAGLQFAQPTEVRQVDNKSGADHLAAGTADELGGRFGGAAGGDQVVDDEDALTFADGILVDFDGVDAVLERVLLPDGLPRQFTLFTNRDESAAEPVRDCTAQNETPGLDPGYRVHALSLVWFGKRDDRLLEAVGIAQQGRDVPEHDAGLWIIWNRPDQPLQLVHHHLLDAQLVA